MKIMGNKFKNLIYLSFKLFLMMIFIIYLASCSSAIIVKDKIENEKKDISQEKLVKSTADIYLRTGSELKKITMPISNENKINDIRKYLENDIEDEGLYKTILNSKIIEDIVLENKVLNVYLSSYYKELDDVNAILFRSSLVKTYTSLDDVDEVSFYFGKVPLKDSNNIPLINYSANDVLHDDEVDELSYYVDVSLYYPRDNKLKLYLEEIEISVNETMVDKVIDRLMTKSENNPSPAIPMGTKVLSANIVDGVCFLNLSEDFFTNDSGDKKDNLAIFSIVNSLTQIAEVSKVQFLIEGEKKDLLRGENYIYDSFDFNYEIVE